MSDVDVNVVLFRTYFLTPKATLIVRNAGLWVFENRVIRLQKNDQLEKTGCDKN